MYILKNNPVDFIVKEIPSIEPSEKGDFTYFWMMKKRLTTSDAIRRVAAKARVNPNKIGFAGSKDRIAVTWQLISMRGKSDFSLKEKDLEVTFFGKGNVPLRLGLLAGNEFHIRVCNLKTKPHKILKFLNLYGEQRFGTNNAEIGKLLVKKEFKKAVDIMVSSHGGWEEQVKEYIKHHKNDYIGAIRVIPREIAIMFVHSYQSLLWNRCALKIESFSKENLPVPLIGFETDIEDFKYHGILNQAMEEESIKTRDFIIRQIPGFSYPGGMRMLYSTIYDLRVGELRNRSCKLSFHLDKGSYATVAVKQMLSSEDIC